MSHSIDIGNMKAHFDTKTGDISLSSKDEESPLKKNGIVFNVAAGTKRHYLLKEMIESNSFSEGKKLFVTDKKLPKIVHLGDKYRSKDSNTVPLGIDIDRRTLFWDIQNIPHLMITGFTNTGKTTLAKSIIDHVCTHRKETRAIYCNRKSDQNDTGFKSFKNIHENVQFIKEEKDESVLSRIYEMMNERYQYLEDNELKSIEPAIRIGEFKRVFFIADELRSFGSRNQNSHADDLLSSILNLGAAVGIHFVIILHAKYTIAKERFPEINATIATHKAENERFNSESIFKVEGEDSKLMKPFSI